MSSTSTLRDLLSRVKLPSDDDTYKSLAAELKVILDALGQPGINEEFRSDILRVITASLDLGKTVSSSVYQLDEVLASISVISTRISFLLHHLATSRPRTPGYGLVHQDSGRILPNLFLNESEANQYVESMRSMGLLPPSIAIIPVEIASRYVVRPRVALPPPAAPVPPAPQPLQDDPLPSVLKNKAEKEKKLEHPETPPPFEPAPGSLLKANPPHVDPFKS